MAVRDPALSRDPDHDVGLRRCTVILLCNHIHLDKMTDITATTSSSPPPVETMPVIDTPVSASSNPFRPPSESPSQSIVPPTTPSPITTSPPSISSVGAAGTASTSESILDLPARPPPEVQTREAVIDPRVVALRGMFPDYDDLILCALFFFSAYLRRNMNEWLISLITLGNPC